MELLMKKEKFQLRELAPTTMQKLLPDELKAGLPLCSGLLVRGQCEGGPVFPQRQK